MVESDSLSFAKASFKMLLYMSVQGTSECVCAHDSNTEINFVTSREGICKPPLVLSSINFHQMWMCFLSLLRHVHSLHVVNFLNL